MRLGPTTAVGDEPVAVDRELGDLIVDVSTGLVIEADELVDRRSQVGPHADRAADAPLGQPARPKAAIEVLGDQAVQ